MRLLTCLGISCGAPVSSCTRSGNDCLEHSQASVCERGQHRAQSAWGAGQREVVVSEYESIIGLEQSCTRKNTSVGASYMTTVDLPAQ